MKWTFASLIALALSPLAATSSVSSQSALTLPILVKNNCPKTISLWIRHADGYRNWHNHGDFTIAAYGSSYLEDGGVLLSQRTDHDLYLYALAADVSYVWDGEYVTYHGGYTLPMKNSNYSSQSGTAYISLTC